jgi:phosphatidylserine/phosphatidylglycerophosphate/cardiolipin synthase-like enzyme
MLWHSLLSPLTREYSVTTYNYERQPNQDVQKIINSRPKKILSGWKIRITCECLVKINQAKSQIKETHERLFPDPENNQADGPEEDMEDIVGRGAAR